MKKENKILSLLRSPQAHGAKGLICCYAVCTVLFLAFKLCMGLFIFICFQTGVYTQQSLTLNDFEQYGVEQTDDMTMVNGTDDTQLWLVDNLYNLYVNCSFSYSPGEFIVYYSSSTDGVFSPDKCVHARLIGDYYIFELPLGTKMIRMDTGIYPSVTVSFKEITANKYTFNSVMRFSVEQLFYLLIIPAVLYAVLDLALGLRFFKVRERAALSSDI